jgi:hypothetical protein
VDEGEDPKSEVVEFSAALGISLALMRPGVRDLPIDLDHDVRVGELEVDPGDRDTIASMNHLAGRLRQARFTDDSEKASFKSVCAAAVSKHLLNPTYAGSSSDPQLGELFGQEDHRRSAVSDCAVDSLLKFRLGTVASEFDNRSARACDPSVINGGAVDNSYCPRRANRRDRGSPVSMRSRHEDDDVIERIEAVESMNTGRAPGC